MALTAKTVNLDAMIQRADFAATNSENFSADKIQNISIRDFMYDQLLGSMLRKPDFQRETNHWGCEQVVRLLECFVNGDLVPSVILWQSPNHVFVIDGGHRLSALRAYVEDDYGDGPISRAYFANEIPKDQLQAAKKTRNMIDERIGSWKHHQSLAKQQIAIADDQQRMKMNLTMRALPIQWVVGDAGKAESSFFTINTKGAELDRVEELLLKNRKKPIAIAARAIIRSATGHKYWSSFPPPSQQKVEALAKQLHSALFDPEFSNPVKTLDLPLGGPKGMRAALEALIDLALIATRKQSDPLKALQDTADDADGTATLSVLTTTLSLIQRITGNERGSLGLHPAVYFYGVSGRHSNPMFMGTITLVAEKLATNDQTFFQSFTSVRAKVEAGLIANKETISQILSLNRSSHRTAKYAELLGAIIKSQIDGKRLSPRLIVDLSGIATGLVIGSAERSSTLFSPEAKSQIFLTSALKSALKCPICSGYLDTTKSVSYDHILEKKNGGDGAVTNGQLSHPYCNNSIKG